MTPKIVVTLKYNVGIKNPEYYPDFKIFDKSLKECFYKKL